MNIDAISTVLSSEITKPFSIMQMQQSQKTEFLDYMNTLYNDINIKINDADIKLRKYALGETTNIHDLLLTIEKAKTSFELGLQVRNRLLEGYQEIMRMQV